MRRYEYTVGRQADLDGSGNPTYPVMCRSWDESDSDSDSDSWSRVVNWCTSRDTAQAECDSYTANCEENRTVLEIHEQQNERLARGYR